MASIPKRQDVSPKEGVNEYGKVPFADPVNKKYPIDTEEHIRAAWNYINKAANAGKYDSGVAAIKAHIVAAWRRVIDKAGPPSASMSDSGPTLRKNMTIAYPIGYYKNGPQEGEVDAQRLRDLVANTQKRGKPVPIYNLVGKAEPDHPDSLDQWPADGWAEGLSIGPRGELIADSKIHGEAARMVIGDMVRGASIGTKHKQLTPAGDEIGEILEHVVLTNNPFMSGMNIAARLAKGGDGLAYTFTALTKEAAMAEEQKDEKETADLSLTERLEAAEVLTATQAGQIEELSAANANLLEEVKAYKKAPQLEIAMKELNQQKRINLANKIRFITARMAADRQVSMEVLRGWYDHDSDEVVLAGFKSSQFKGNIDLLQYHRDSVKKNPIGRGFVSGGQGDEGAAGFTVDEKKAIEELGHDPEELAATSGSRNFTEWKKRRDAAKKEK